MCRMMSAYVYHYPKRLVTGMVNHCKLGPTSSYLEIREPMKNVLLWFGNPENRQKQQGDRTSQGKKYVWRDLCFLVLCILHFTSWCFLPADVGLDISLRGTYGRLPVLLMNLNLFANAVACSQRWQTYDTCQPIPWTPSFQASLHPWFSPEISHNYPELSLTHIYLYIVYIFI